MEKENKILIFRTSITKRCDIKRIGKLLAEFPQIENGMWTLRTGRKY